MKTFIYWLTIFGLSIVGIYLCAVNGVLKLIVENDKSYISLLIFALYAVVSILNGRASFHPEKHRVSRKVSKFFSTHVMTLGLFGTVIGLIMMTFTTLDSGNDVNKIVGSLKHGMSTALFTTCVGIYSGLFNLLQNFVIELNEEQ